MALAVLIVGGGRVGTVLAHRLVDAAHHVIVVDRDAVAIEMLWAQLPDVRGIVGDGTDPAVLEAAGARTVDAVAAVTGDDAANVAVLALARLAFTAPRTIARIVDPSRSWLFHRDLGVDVALDQAALLVSLVVEELSLGEVATLVKLRRGDLDLIEERLPTRSRAAGVAVAELGLPPTCVLVAVLRDGEVLVAHAGLALAEGDEVLAIAHRDEVGRLGDALAPGPEVAP